MESGQRFFRKQLSGKLTFVRDDYTLIMSATYEQTLHFYVEISTDYGLTYSQYWEGTFSRTDCTINYDDKSIQVQPTTLDAYKNVLKGIEKEYNLIELLPEIQRLIVAKRPLIQVYVPGDSVVSCFLSGCHWEQDADEVTNGYTLINTYHFALNTIVKEIEVASNGGLDEAAGTYTGRVTYDEVTHHWVGNLYQQNNGAYYIAIDTNDINMGDMHWTFVSAILTRQVDGVQLYGYLTSGDFGNITFTMTPVSGSGMSGTMGCDMWTYNIFARLLCDVESLFGTATNTIPDDDIVENNRNYKRCAGYSVPIASISNRTSDEPTEYGRRDDGKYFAPPANIINRKYYPIAQSTWRWASLWFVHNYVDQETDRVARKQYVLQDAYPIASCISVLLKEINPNITHEATTDYSQFLYSETNPISGDKWALFATQKTNILKGEYTEPARKAITTLQEFLKMLQSVFNCYWYVEDNKLKIEHISFFKNGGAYSGTRQVGYDLTTLTNVKNGKPWCYGQNEISFDKQDLPERYQYGWMDETTEAFDGLPIEILSPNVEDGKIEDVTVGNFTSDVDYMLLNPSACSEDGFALLAAVPANALIDDDSEDYSPGFYGSHGEDGVNNNYSTPLYPIITDFIGKQCSVKMECSGNGRCEAHFFDSNGTTLGGCYYYHIEQGTTEFTMNGTIPEGAVAFGFFMNYGSLDFNVFKVSVAGEYELPFIKKTIDNADFRLQNGYLAMIDLQPKYLTYDMPSYNINVNGSDTTANGMSRKAKQTIVFPSDALDVDTNKLVKTLVGFGEFSSISLNLSSRMIKATLNYDNNV